MQIRIFVACLVVLISWITPTAFAQRAPLLCYSSKATLYAPQYNGAASAWLDDSATAGTVAVDPNDTAGGISTTQVRKVSDVCLPTAADGRTVADPDSHWVLYQTKGIKAACANDPALPCGSDADCAGVGGACVATEAFDKKDVRNSSVRVVDAHNDTRINLGKEVALLAPASFDPSAHLGSPPSAEHYKCYAVKQSKAACVGGSNGGKSCKSDGDCPLSTCADIAKFPKQTHPNGLVTDLETFFTEAFDSGDPEKPYALRKLRYFCQATDLKLAAEPVVEASDPQAGLLCYTLKAEKYACHGGSNDNGLCSSNDDCPGGGSCRFESKMDSKDPRTRGLYVDDTFFNHELDVRKENVYCVPACKEPPAADVFGDNVLRVDTLQLAATGHAFVPLAGIANPLIVDQVASGSINLLLEADRFGDGSQTINSYTGNLDPSNAGCDVDDPSALCEYRVSEGSLDPTQYRLDTTCGKAGIIDIPVEVSGSDSEPDATLSGGSADTGFAFSFPFTSTVTIALALTDVHIAGELQHSGGKFTGLQSGTLSGAVIHREFKQTANNLPQGLCQGGTNNNEPCFLSDALCTGGGLCNPQSATCNGGTNNGTPCGSDEACPDPRGPNPSNACNETYIGGFTPGQVGGFIDLIPRDTDLDGLTTCEGATNNGEPCADLSQCPDQNGPAGATCDPYEASSLLFDLTAIDAAISGIDP